mgnify:CR=1 FL=1
MEHLHVKMRGVRTIGIIGRLIVNLEMKQHSNVFE